MVEANRRLVKMILPVAIDSHSIVIAWMLSLLTVRELFDIVDMLDAGLLGGVGDLHFGTLHNLNSLWQVQLQEQVYSYLHYRRLQL
jgi:hypothetical protein